MTPYYQDEAVCIYHGDCRDLLPLIADASIDLVLTDPPYPAEYAWCWDVLAREGYRVLRDRRSLVTLLGHYQVPEVLRLFAATPFRYWWMLGMLQDRVAKLYGKNVSICWKPAMWFVKGLHRSDLVDFPMDMVRPKAPAKLDHPWEQGLGWFDHHLDRLSAPGETICDPFMGTGTTLVAAKRLGRKAIGIEIERKYCDVAVERLAQAALPLEMGA